MMTGRQYAVQFIEKRKAALVESEMDRSPLAPNEIAGRTIVSLISTGSERGAYMDYFGGTVYPVSTGYAAVIEVLETGSAVTNVKVGDRVLALAPHQLYNRVKSDEISIVPEGMNPAHAVMGRFPAVSMTSMIHTSIKPTEPVLVTGLGVVGLMCAQMMRHCGYEVYAFDPNENRRETARACGIRHVYASLDEVPEVKGVAGLAMECSGREEGTYSLVANLRRGGELYLIGVPWYRSTDTFAHELLKSVFYGFIQLRSGFEWSLPRHSRDFMPNSNFASIAKSMEWIRDGHIKVEGIYEVAAPERCDDIYSSMADGTMEKTCAIFDWSRI